MKQPELTMARVPLAERRSSGRRQAICCAAWLIAGLLGPQALLAQTPPPYAVTPVLFVPTPSSFPAGYQPTAEQLAQDQADISLAMYRCRVWYGEALGLPNSFNVRPVVYMAALGGLSNYGIVWTDPTRRYSDGISLDQGTSTWGSVTNEVRTRGYTPGTSNSPRMVVIFCKGAGGFAGGAQWWSMNGGGMCLLGDWCLDSLAERVPPQDWSWWTGVDRQTAATGHEMGHTIGMPHPDITNPVTGQQDWAYTLMGWWWDWPTYPTNPADPTWPLHGLHAWASNSGPSGATIDYMDEFLLAHRMGWFNTNVLDGDADGLLDSWEIEVFGDLTHTPGQDEEPDGLTNLEEYGLGTDPLDADSDDDGLTDGFEVETYGSDPLDADSDDDGLSDAAEYSAGTNPHNPDSDADQMPDLWEVQNGLNPLVDDAAADPDQDGVTNLAEYQGGSDPQLPWSVPVPQGTALAFDGLDDYVNLGDVAVSGTQLTIEAWVRPTGSGSARLLDKLEDYGLQLSSGNVVRFVTKYGYTWDNLDGQISTPAGEWVHVAGVLTGSSKAIYVNGQLDSEKAYAQSIKVTTNALLLGANSPTPTQGFLNGVLDEVRIWNVARTPAEIQATMNATVPPATPGLVGYWDLDEGTGQIAHDLAGAHDGRLGSSTGVDSADPAWTASTVASELGPAISVADPPTFVGSGASITLAAEITDAGQGGNGVASAVLYYGYAWPHNAEAVSGVGPGGNGDGTWSFVLPPQGAGHEGDTLRFFLRADDSAGNPSFAINNGVLYAVDVRRPGDWDGNGDCDLRDAVEFPDCLSGPQGVPADWACGIFDWDGDEDIDLWDWSALTEVVNSAGG